MFMEVKKEELEKGETMEVIEETNLERVEEQNEENNKSENEGGEREGEVYVIPIKTLYKKIKTSEENLTNTLSDFGLKKEQLLEMVKEKLNNIKYYARYEDNSDLEIARNRLLFIDRIKNDIEKLDKLAKNKITYELMRFPFTSKDLDDLYYNVFIPFSTAKDTYHKIKEIEKKVSGINLERIEEEIESIKQEVKRLEGETLTGLKDEINQKIESKIAELREEINQLKEDLSKDGTPEDDRLAQLQDEINQLKEEVNQLRRTTEEHGATSESEDDRVAKLQEEFYELQSLFLKELEKFQNKEDQEIDLGLFDASSKRISEIEEEIRSLRENINLSQFKDELMREVSRIVRSEIERIGVNKDSSGINIEEIQTIVEGIIEKKVSDLKLVKDNQQQEEGKEEETNMKRVMDNDNNNEVKQERESDKKKDIIQTLKENPKWILVIIAVLVAIGVFLGNRL